jgi:hypothetical protein
VKALLQCGMSSAQDSGSMQRMIDYHTSNGFSLSVCLSTPTPHFELLLARRDSITLVGGRLWLLNPGYLFLVSSLFRA